MWPVFIDKFNSEFLRNHAGGEVHLIILFLHQFFTIIYVLGCVGKLGITAFRRMFILQMWPVLALQFDFGFLSNDAAVLHLIILVLHLFPTIIYVLRCVRKLRITPFMRMSHLVNVASIRLTIQFRVFEQ